MKKNKILSSILALSLLFTQFAFAAELEVQTETVSDTEVSEDSGYSEGYGDDDIAILTDNERENLLNWGMSQETLDTLTYGELREFLATVDTILLDSPTTYSTANETSPSDEPGMEEIRLEKNLTIEEMEMLYNLSIFPEQVAVMTEDELREILEPYTDTVPFSARSKSVSNIPYFGQYESESATYFHDSVDTRTSAIQTYCDRSMIVAEHCFNTSYNFSSTRSGQNIAFSYNLWGELTGNVSHEGVDMVNKVDSHCDIHSATPGPVVGPVDGTYGQVRIYDRASDNTVVYLHMDGIPSWVKNKSYDVTLADTIGYQSDAGVDAIHLHVQVQPGEYTATYLPSQSDYALSSMIPYGTLVWHL